jgi:putative phosphoesterase
MNVRLLLIADTHLPLRARALPEVVWREVEAADVVFHAGDWVQSALLDELEARAKRLVGVYGNNDGEDLRARLPEIARVELGGLRFAMIHETGAAQGRERRCDLAFPEDDVLWRV